MQHLKDSFKARLKDRRGITMPTVIFGSVIMTTIAVVALSTSLSEQRSSQAVRGSLEAFYTAETGLNVIQTELNDPDGALFNQVKWLQSGGIVNVDWRELPAGGSYRAEIMRINEWEAGGGPQTGQPYFYVTVVGRDASGQGGERSVGLILTPFPATLTLGGCCAAAATVRGKVDVNSGTGIDGTDAPPPPWSGGTCDEYPSHDKPGLIVNDPPDLEISSNGYIRSGDTETNSSGNLVEPAIVIDDQMSDDTFDQYGTQSWQDIKNNATHFIGHATDPNREIKYRYGGNPVSDLEYDDDRTFGPRVHSLTDPHGHLATDPLLGTCDTGNNLNFGAPTGPCSNHFPVVLVSSEVEMWWGTDPNRPYWMQGIFILNEKDGIGSEFELEVGEGTFAGLIIGKGCVEIQSGAQVYGSIFIDSNFFNFDLCWDQNDGGGDDPLEIRDTAHVQYSECVIQRVLEESGIGEESVEQPGGIHKIASRSFAEVLR
jgi:hypothetical protein